MSAGVEELLTRVAEVAGRKLTHMVAVRPDVVVGARMDAVCAAATVGAALGGARGRGAARHSLVRRHAAARDRGGMLVGWGALRGRERGAPSRAPAPQRR